MKIGFLPLYIELYDRVAKAAGVKAREFADAAAQKLRARGLEIVAAPACRLASEFQAAVKGFEEAQCEAILTLHLAYSPALEAIDALAGSALPIVIMDTTPDAEFSSPESQLMANHGIHGVQDLGNLLIRRDKRFLITAGPFDDALLARVEKLLASAVMSFKMSHLRIGRIGGEFEGMGDFRFAPADLNLTEVNWSTAPAVTDTEVAAEMADDRKNFTIRNLPETIHAKSVRSGLALRRWVAQEKLDGFTMCFLHTDGSCGWETVPFLECSKSMARGIGYAGEGDTLTAGLHAALFKAFPACGFSEMFCPDWQGNRIFTSHMGEINPALTAEKPLLAELNYVFGDADNPAVAYGCFKPGKALWVNLAPLAAGKFRLITAPLEFLEQPAELKGAACNSGWFRPVHGSVAELLEQYTKLGGTHHAVVVYDGDTKILKDFAYLMKWEFVAL